MRNHRRPSALRPLLCLAVLLLLSARVPGQPVPNERFRTIPESLKPPAPTVPGRSAVLVELTTGTEILARNGDASIPPASLTKIATIDTVMSAVERGEVSLGDYVPIPPEATARAMPKGSSLMFLEEGQRVTLEELLLGLVVSSGNDAAIAVALHLSGSVEAFVHRMNDTVRALGLTRTQFVDPSGLDPRNTTTALEFAAFLAHHLSRFPDLRRDIYSVAEFAYPKPQNLPAGSGSPTIVQQNRNALVGADPRVDGIKTGFIDESGYNIAVSGTNGELELVAVVLGIEAPNHAEGGHLRARAARELLDYGFESYSLVTPAPPPLEPVRVWEGETPHVLLSGAPQAIVLPQAAVARLSGTVYQEYEVTAPVTESSSLGRVVYAVGEIEVLTMALTPTKSVAVAGPVTRLWDRARRSIRGLWTRSELRRAPSTP